MEEHEDEEQKIIMESEKAAPHNLHDKGSEKLQLANARAMGANSQMQKKSERQSLSNVDFSAYQRSEVN